MVFQPSFTFRGDEVHFCYAEVTRYPTAGDVPVLYQLGTKVGERVDTGQTPDTGHPPAAVPGLIRFVLRCLGTYLEQRKAVVQLP